MIRTRKSELCDKIPVSLSKDQTDRLFPTQAEDFAYPAVRPQTGAPQGTRFRHVPIFSCVLVLLFLGGPDQLLAGGSYGSCWWARVSSAIWAMHLDVYADWFYNPRDVARHLSLFSCFRIGGDRILGHLFVLQFRWDDHWICCRPAGCDNCFATWLFHHSRSDRTAPTRSGRSSQ